MNNHINKISIMSTISIAWHKVGGAKATFWAIIFFVFLAQFVSSGFHKLAFIESGVVAVLFTVLAIIAAIIRSLIIWSLIYIGGIRALDKPIRYTMMGYLFDLNLIFRIIGLYILIALIILPSAILMSLPALISHLELNTNQWFVVIVGILSFIGSLTTIYLCTRLYIAKVVLVVDKISPWDAVKVSFASTKSHVWGLIGLSIINIFILAISAIPFGIGLIWSIPYFFINYGVVYKKLLNKK